MQTLHIEDFISFELLLSTTAITVLSIFYHHLNFWMLELQLVFPTSNHNTTQIIRLSVMCNKEALYSSSILLIPCRCGSNKKKTSFYHWHTRSYTQKMIIHMNRINTQNTGLGVWESFSCWKLLLLSHI